MSGWALQQSFYSIPHVPESRNPHFHYTFHHHNSCYCCCFVLISVSSDFVPLEKDKELTTWGGGGGAVTKSWLWGTLCFVSKSKFRVTYGAFTPPLAPSSAHLGGSMGGGGVGGEAVGGGGFQRWCSNGLLMWAMLRMMELRGLTNFGKSEQEEESRGGDLGPFVTACLILEFKKMAQRCCEI